MPSLTGEPLGPAWGGGEMRFGERVEPVGLVKPVGAEDGALDIEAATCGTE